MSADGPGRAGGGVTPREDEPTTDGPGEPVTGTASAVREVDVLPDGRRVTWYRSTTPDRPQDRA